MFISITESSSLVGINMETQITTGRCCNCDEWSLSQRTTMFKVFEISVAVSCHRMATTNKWELCKEFASQCQHIWCICGKSLIKQLMISFSFYFSLICSIPTRAAASPSILLFSPEPILLFLIWLQWKASIPGLVTKHSITSHNKVKHIPSYGD